MSWGQKGWKIGDGRLKKGAYIHAIQYKKANSKRVMTPFKFGQYQLVPQFGQYRNNSRVSITLIDAEDGIPFAVATVNLPDEKLEENEIAIKNHSENEGILWALQEAGIVGQVKREVQSGFVRIPIVELLEQ